MKRSVQLGTVVACVLALLAGWAVVRFVRKARDLGYTDSAIGTIHILVNNEKEFARAHPSIGFSCSLTDVAGELKLVEGNRNGYFFKLSDCRADAVQGPNTRLHITARPLSVKLPAFCSDESGVLREDDAGSDTNCQANGQPR